MTREELIDYIDEQQALKNIPYHVYATLIDGIDTLEQEPILNKIRAKIKDWQTDIHDNEYDADKYDFVFERIFEIIDEYKEESEDA